MVESEAKELSEEIMLGAVDLRPSSSIQPVIDAIIELAEQCAKEPWDLPEKPAIRTETMASAARCARGRAARRLHRNRTSRRATDQIDEVKKKAMVAVR